MTYKCNGPGGVTYVVGRDAHLSQGASFSRVLDPSYANTDVHLALVLGAIAYMNVPRIDVLVVGLPVSNHHELSGSLIRRLTGVHRVPGPNGVDVEVKVDHVMVIPQPVGGMLDYSIRNEKYACLSRQVNLVIDPGYYTLDWVLAQGVKMVGARSGAHDGGMSAVLAAIADQVSTKIRTPIKDLSRIDEAIRTVRPPDSTVRSSTFRK